MPLRAERHLKLRDTPGGIITAYAYNYSVKFFDYADQKLPEFKQYPSETRYMLLQAAIIVSTLVLTAKSSGGVGEKELHDNVSDAFVPPDATMAGTLGRSAWTSAIMIVRLT